jgi:hypothetical protein
MMWQAGSLRWNMRKTATGGGRGHGGRRPWFLVWFYEKKGVMWNLLTHGPVLDDNFSQDGTIAIFIVTVT